MAAGGAVFIFLLGKKRGFRSDNRRQTRHLTPNIQSSEALVVSELFLLGGC